MKHGILRTLIAAVLCACLVFSMASCSVLESLGILGKDPEDPACEHRDADDNSLCDECGEEYTDGKDLPDEPVCQHRDADDNNLCDKCGEAFEDGKDVADEPECTHRDADDNNLCDSCGEAGNYCVINTGGEIRVLAPTSSAGVTYAFCF